MLYFCSFLYFAGWSTLSRRPTVISEWKVYCSKSHSIILDMLQSIHRFESSLKLVVSQTASETPEVEEDSFSDIYVRK